MLERAAREPALHDALRAIGNRLVSQGARSAAVSRSADGVWVVVPSQDERAMPMRAAGRAQTLTPAETISLVAEARTRRGIPRMEATTAVPTLEAILRAGGDALERNGQQAFLLLADYTGVVCTGIDPITAPISISAEELQRSEQTYAEGRLERQTIYHPGQQIWYQPRGALSAIPVTVQRLGAHQITVRLPGGEIAAVHRKWLRPFQDGVSPDADEPSTPLADNPVWSLRDALAAGDVDRLVATLTRGVGLASTDSAGSQQAQTIVDWLLLADTSASPAEIEQTSIVRQAIIALASQAAQPRQLLRALLQLRPRLHRALRQARLVGGLGFDLLTSADNRLDSLVTSALDAAGARPRDDSPAVLDPVEAFEEEDELSSSLHDEIIALRDVAAQIEAARTARRWLLDRHRRREGSSPDQFGST